MIRSMTAFARAEGPSELGTLACELRTVNHRYLDVSPRLPEELRALEPVLRERLGKHLGRGKVEVSLRLRGAAGTNRLQLDHDAVQRLALLQSELGKAFPVRKPDTIQLLHFPGVLREPAVDGEALKKAVLAVLEEALQSLCANREREGARLAGLLHERLAGIETQVVVLRDMMPQLRAALRRRLEQRLAELDQPVEPGRLEQELVLQANRADVDEELDRLDAHVAEVRDVLERDEPVGRRLDFLMQELNREANTLGSKAVDERSSRAAVELKVLIEQMREQVQNIE